MAADTPTVRIFITSSTSIKPKAALCISTLCPEAPAEGESLPPTESVLLEARSATANKAITIAQIARREIEAKGGKWFQYTKIGTTMVKNKKRKRVQQDIGETGAGAKKSKSTGGETDEAEVIAVEKGMDHEMEIEGEESNDTEEFEDTLISIHLSNHPIPSLAEELGEQSSTPTEKASKKDKTKKKKSGNRSSKGADVLIRSKGQKKGKNKEKPTPKKSS